MKSSLDLVHHEEGNTKGGKESFLYPPSERYLYTCSGSPAIASASILTQAYTACWLALQYAHLLFCQMMYRQKGRKMRCHYGFAVYPLNETVLLIEIHRPHLQVKRITPQTIIEIYRIIKTSPSYTESPLCPGPQRTARSSAIIVATAPSIFSGTFSCPFLYFQPDLFL